MANVISKDQYLSIAADYDLAYESLLGPSSYLYDAVYSVVLLQDVLPEVDLVNPFYNAYSVGSSSDVPSSWISAVRAINQHVLTRGGYSDIDTYLGASTVPQNWATLSALAGYQIDNVA